MPRNPTQTAPKPAGWRSRIVGAGEEPPQCLLANPRNWRTHPKAQQDALAGVLDEVGWVQDVIVNRRTGHIVDGHLRVSLAISREEPMVPVKYVDLSPDEEALVLATLDPLAGMAATAKDALEALLIDIGSPGGEALQGLLADIARVEGIAASQEDHPSLVERFLVPPFSVLDTRQGYWQDRKRQWLALGIQSELGRGDYPLGLYGQDLMRGEYVVGISRQNADRRSNLTNVPALPDWAVGTGTENMAVGTSIFDPVLCELAYRWFCPPGGAILDPFAGGSVRGIVASILGRRYTGIDLSAVQIAANEEQATQLTPENPPTWIEGDGREAGTLAAGEYDLFFSCPPYGDLERYSDDPRDLSTMGYADFLMAYREIVEASVALLRPDRFACFVVGDFRDKRGFYRNFVSHTIDAFQHAGMALYNEAILVQALGSLPIRVGKQFTSGRKLGKTHQNVLVFVKGDPKAATAACGPVDVSLPTVEEPALVP